MYQTYSAKDFKCCKFLKYTKKWQPPWRISILSPVVYRTEWKKTWQWYALVSSHGALRVSGVCERRERSSSVLRSRFVYAPDFLIFLPLFYRLSIVLPNSWQNLQKLTPSCCFCVKFALLLSSMIAKHVFTSVFASNLRFLYTYCRVFIFFTLLSMLYLYLY